MKILVTGAKGQLGNKIIELLDEDHDLILTDSDTMDITKSEQIEFMIKDKKPDIVLHLAAYTKVDQAEEDRELCYLINAEGTKNIAESAKANDIPVIYISTDFVFDGKKTTPYVEEDEVKPLSVYGQTKLDGENFIRETCDKYFIIRVAWLFGELPAGHPGSNFVETMIHLANQRDSISVVNDQIGSPTYTGDLVRFIGFVLKNNPEYGTYHISGEGETSWYDFAKEIFAQTGIKIDLKPITSAEYPSKAKRPAYSYLSKNKLKSTGFKARPWQEMLKEYLKRRN